jgi:antitoxin VapB
MSEQVSPVFTDDTGQAVRIPQEFRLHANRVSISRNDAGDLVIRALPTQRGTALMQALQGFDAELADELAELVRQDRLAQSDVQERDEL